HSIGVQEKQVFRALFTFQMPYLPSGDYSIAVALAEGTQADHIQHHWMDEALIFKCECSHVTHGLLGIPMENIRIHLESEETVSLTASAKKIISRTSN